MYIHTAKAWSGLKSGHTLTYIHIYVGHGSSSLHNEGSLCCRLCPPGSRGSLVQFRLRRSLPSGTESQSLAEYTRWGPRRFAFTTNATEWPGRNTCTPHERNTGVDARASPYVRVVSLPLSLPPPHAHTHPGRVHTHCPPRLPRTSTAEPSEGGAPTSGLGRCHTPTEPRRRLELAALALPRAGRSQGERAGGGDAAGTCMATRARGLRVVAGGREFVCVCVSSYVFACVREFVCVCGRALFRVRFCVRA